MQESLATPARWNKIKRWLGKWPLYILLLPLFFIAHGVRENFGFITVGDAGSLLLFYWAVILPAYLLLLLLYRRLQPAGLLTFWLSAIFFFYGAIQDFLKAHIVQLNRYIILIPFFGILTIILAIWLKRSTGKHMNFSRYLNLLLLLLLMYDGTAMALLTIFPEKDKFSIYPFKENADYSICQDCPKPDIYLLLFDEYASSENLKNYLHFDNGQLDSFFVQHKFSIQKSSSGNYNYTPFAMSSVLNMSYINGLENKEINIDDFSRSIKLVKEDKLIKLLSEYGYDIVNYSIFDLAGNPTPIHQDFLPLKTKLITDRTLWGKFKDNLLWNLFTGRFEVKWFTRNFVYWHLNNNNKVFDLVQKESAKKSSKPRFIYAHFNLPHSPYYFDKEGRLKDKDVIRTDYSHDAYLGNVLYANKKIMELVTGIQSGSNGKAAIIVMGDHGYRTDTTLPKKVFLENQNAVYLPGQDYHLFYDSITGVNQFRVIINSLFKQQLPLLKDSTTILKPR